MAMFAMSLSYHIDDWEHVKDNIPGSAMNKNFLGGSIHKQDILT